MSGDVVRLCRNDDLAPGATRRLDVAGHGIALTRIGDRYYPGPVFFHQALEFLVEHVQGEPGAG